MVIGSPALRSESFTRSPLTITVAVVDGDAERINCIPATLFTCGHGRFVFLGTLPLNLA